MNTALAAQVSEIADRLERDGDEHGAVAKLREAAAALSGREAVGEVRIADGCIVSTSIKRPLPDGGYDVVPQGATTPPPGDGVVVPSEPTDAMVKAGRDHDDLADSTNVRRIYAAMLAAAPSAKGV